MKIGIIGAGIAGLAAARTLKSLNCETIIYEESAEVGGRIATSKIGQYIFDVGTSSLVPRQHELGKVFLEELDTAQLVKIDKPIYLHAYGRITPSSNINNTLPRYTYRTGNNLLAKMLANDLNVIYDKKIARIEKNDPRKYTIADTEFDGLIICTPIPETKELLATMGETRALVNVRYRPCINISFGYNESTGDLPYHAIIDPDQQHPLTWLCIESIKSPERAPINHTAMVAQLGPAYSHDHMNAPEEVIVSETLAYIERLFGKKFAQPTIVDVKRWLYSQPEITAQFENVNRPSHRVLVASDGIMGGRTELAYDAGAQAAKQLYETLSNDNPPVGLKVV